MHTAYMKRITKVESTLVRYRCIRIARITTSLLGCCMQEKEMQCGTEFVEAHVLGFYSSNELEPKRQNNLLFINYATSIGVTVYLMSPRAA